MKLGEDMEIKIEDVKKLRDMTGAGMMAAKNALVEAKGDMEKAVEVLRLAGQASAAKKADREARTDDFKDFARDIAMQIAASNPEYVSPEDIPETVIEKEKEIYRAEMDGQNKPAEVIEKIVDGKLGKYYETVCLTHQAFVKDPDKKVDDLTKAMIAKLGENIVIRRFERLELGGN
jgi:elongation factor Ts